MSKSMEDYIRETAQVVKENIKSRKRLTSAFCAWFKGSQLTVVASGSSYNAAVMAVPFIKKYTDIQVEVLTPFTFTYSDEEPKRESSYVFVSQSGCSTNVLEALRKYQKAGGEAVAIVGNLDSTIGKKADSAMEYGVGEETVGYVTKGMNTLSLFFMLAALESRNAVLSQEQYENCIEELINMADNHRYVYEQAKRFVLVHEKAFLSMQHIYMMGSEANRGAVLEGALKTGEMVHVQTSTYEAEEFIHGPNLQLTPEYTLFFMDSGDKAGVRIRDIYKASKEVTDHTFLISVTGKNGDENCLDFSSQKQTGDAVAGFYLVAFFQYLSYWVSKELHIEVEHPLLDRFDERIPSKTEDYSETVPF